MPSILDRYGLGEGSEEDEERSILERYGLSSDRVSPDPLQRFGLDGERGEGTLIGKALGRGSLRSVQNVINAARGATFNPITEATGLGREGNVRAKDLLGSAAEVFEPGPELLPSRELNTAEQVITGAVEAVPQLATTIGAFLAGGPLAGSAAAFTQGFGAAYGDAARKPGASETERVFGAAASGLVEVAGEALPVGRLAKILKGPLQGPKKILVDAAKQALIEGATEAPQELLQRVVALATFAQDENWTTEDWRQAAIAGGSGALLGFATGGLAGGANVTANVAREIPGSLQQRLGEGREGAIPTRPDVEPQILEEPPRRVMDEASVAEDLRSSGLDEVGVQEAIQDRRVAESRYTPPPVSLPILDNGEFTLDSLIETQETGRARRMLQLREEEQKRTESKLGPWNAIMQAVADPDYLVKQAERAVKKRGEGLAARPYQALEEIPWMSSSVQGVLLQTKQEVYDPVEAAGIKRDEFSTWQMLTRIIEGDRSEIDNPIDPPEATLRRFELEQRWGPERAGTARDAARRFGEIHVNQVVRRFIAPSGIATPEQLEAMENNPHWVRFFVQDYLDESRVYAKGVPSYLKRQLGTAKDVGNVSLESHLAQAILIKASIQNEAKLEIVRFLQAHFPDEIDFDSPVRDGKLQDISETGKKTLFYREDGDLKAALVPDFYVDSTVRAFDPPQSAFLKFVNRVVKNPLRALFVEYNPAFALWNTIRDPVRTYFAMRGGPVRDAVELTRAMMGAFKPALQSTFPERFGGMEPEVVLEMLLNNQIPPIGGGVFRSGEMHPDDIIRDLFEDAGFALPASKADLNMASKVSDRLEGIMGERAIEVSKRYISFLAKPSELSERWSKIAGHMITEAHPELFLNQREKSHEVRSNIGTPNHYRKTKIGSLLDAWSLFGNVGMQGLRSSVEVMSRDPKQFAAKAMLVTGLPVALMKAAELGLMGDEVEEAFALIPDHDKRNYFIIPYGMIGAGPERKTAYLRIPRDHFQQLIAGSVWSAIKTMETQEPERLRHELGRLLFDAIPWADPNPVVENAWAGQKIFLRGQNHVDSFTGRPVVDPNALEAGIDVPEQYAKWAWGNAGLSLLINFNDEGAATNYVEELQKTPGVGRVLERFVKFSNAGVRERLWDQYLGPKRKEESRRSYLRRKSLARFVQRGDTDVGELMREHRRQGIQYRNMAELRRRIRSLELREEDPFRSVEEGLSPEQRREIRDLRRAIR